MHYIYAEANESTKRSEYLKISRSLCRREDICIVMFWDDKELMPADTFPLDDEHVETKLAHYNVNKFRGTNRLAVCAVDRC